LSGAAETPPLSGRGRRIALGTLALGVLLAAAGWGLYWWTTLRFIESTDNA
jgi:multidrug resistance efflux pump